MIVADAARTAALAVLDVLVATGLVACSVVLVVAVLDRSLDTLFTPASCRAAADRPERAARIGLGRERGPPVRGEPDRAAARRLALWAGALPFAAEAVSDGISVLTSRSLCGDFAVAEREARRGLWAEAFDG
jgi:hypothetical protein